MKTTVGGVALLAVLAVLGPAHAGFKLQGVAAPEPVAAPAPREPEAPPQAQQAPMSLLPGKGVSDSAVSDARPVSVPAPPLAGTVANSGKDVPLGLAVMQIVPSDRMVTFGPGVDQSASVSWSGGRHWRDILTEVVIAKGLSVRDTDGGVILEKEIGAVERAMAPPPAWRAERGEMLQDILRRWCQSAEVDLEWNADFDFMVKVPVAYSGEFKEAVRTVLIGLSSNKPRPQGRLHVNEQTGRPVLVISTRGGDYFGE